MTIPCQYDETREIIKMFVTRAMNSTPSSAPPTEPFPPVRLAWRR
jgi:hypothetical protein